MDEAELREVLAGLPLGEVRYFDRTGSTNDEAVRWAQAGAPDLSLVVADEQTAGRGRLGRRWQTPPGSALAFSLVLHSSPFTGRDLEGSARLTALGALAVCSALRDVYRLPAEIKWPNDVLVGGRKLSGVLAEAHWQGERLTAAVLGIGVNVAPAAVPAEAELVFPATCVEWVLGRPVERWLLLRAILEALLDWRPRLPSRAFLQAWEARLAYRGQPVEVFTEGETPLAGEVAGLAESGALLLRLPSGELATIQVGEVHLRPVDSPPKSAKLT